ncbi:MAG: hypothetical protein H7Z72_13715 [Bacteroidetes bacterium]|nr:hypothetical protein [Fibrella sp.]
MPKIVVLIGLLALLATGVESAQAQKPARKKTAKTAVKHSHSICGTVTEKRGNQMPGPDRPQPPGQPVVRQVAVFAVLTMEQVVSDESGFITDLKGAKPLQTIRSGKDGKFCFGKLPAGQYSVLVREPKGWYANSFDAQNHLNPVAVKSGQTTKNIVEITHDAAF